MRGKTLALAGVGKDAYPSSAKLNEGEARSKARDTMCAKLRNMTNVKRPRPAGVQGFKSPPPHHFTSNSSADSPSSSEFPPNSTYYSSGLNLSLRPVRIQPIRNRFLVAPDENGQQSAISKPVMLQLSMRSWGPLRQFPRCVRSCNNSCLSH